MYGYLCVTVIESGKVRYREMGSMSADASVTFSSNICVVRDHDEPGPSGTEPSHLALPVRVITSNVKVPNHVQPPRVTVRLLLF